MESRYCSGASCGNPSVPALGLSVVDTAGFRPPGRPFASVRVPDPAADGNSSKSAGGNPSAAQRTVTLGGILSALCDKDRAGVFVRGGEITSLRPGCGRNRPIG